MHLCPFCNRCTINVYADDDADDADDDDDDDDYNDLFQNTKADEINTKHIMLLLCGAIISPGRDIKTNNNDRTHRSMLNRV